MSTKAIKDALAVVEKLGEKIPDARAMHDAAMAEVKAIEGAARFITRVDTNATITPELARDAAEASDTLERIAKESSK